MKNISCMICLTLVLTACASHPVRCDGALRPINPPAAIDKAPAVSPATSGKAGS